MKFNFDEIIDRKGREARSYDSIGKPGYPSLPKEGFDPIPMFSADMDFAVAPLITKSLQDRTKHPIYGYFDMPDKFYEKIIYWHEKTNKHMDLKKENIGYENELLGGLVASLKAMNKPGDKILLHQPTFVGFLSIINDLGYETVTSSLVKDENGIYRMDFEDMENKIKEHDIKTIIIVAPHNPMGRAWEKEELVKASEIFEKYGVKVISDEIWCEIMIGDNVHFPIQNATEYLKYNTVALYSPNKGFNIAGFNISYHIIYDLELKEKIVKEGRKTYYNLPNIMSIYALYGAYSEEGYLWLEELNKVLTRNVKYVEEFFKKNYPEVEVILPQGTYIIYLDFEKYLQEKSMTMDELVNKGYDYGVGWTDARPYNSPYGIKLNLALPFSKIKEAMERIEKYILV